jgi:two-component system, OmpR family, alkaline phosphatase synthesis response regulator PhoP
MSVNQCSIIFVDNSVNRIFKTIDTLKKSFSSVFIFNHEKDFLEFINDNHADVIFLNLDLVPNDGVVLTKEIRQKIQDPTPFVVIYSDKQDDFVQELAFNAGADSFISFHNKASVMELFLKNLLRRRIKISSNSKKEVIIDNERYLIFKNGEAFQLPRKEFRLFELLYNNPEKFFTKTEIAGFIWHDEAIANKRTIDVHIYNIRQFFGKRIVQSQKGKGYRINKKVIG